MRVFVDNNLSHRLARGLNELFKDEHEFFHLTDKFDRDVSDVEWIEALGREGRWVVFSGDMRITRNDAERNAFRTAKLMGFFVSSGLHKKGPVIQAWRILSHWQKIENVVGSMQPGATFQISEKGIKQI